jgi:glycerophosphoryl diester phosphodiesterase
LRVSGKWILAALVAGCGAFAVAVLRKAAKRRVDEGWPTNFAHRGASSRVPENTLEAFRLAVLSGAGGLELDVHMASDGRVVVIHDDSVDRTTEGTGLVRRMTLHEVQSLDAGYRFTPDGGTTYPYRGRDVRVPELGEVLREFPGHRVNIDVKEEQPGVEAALLETIRDAGAGDRVLVVSEMPAVVERVRELSGNSISTGASRREIRDFYRLSRLRLEVLVRPPYDALQVPVEYGGREVVTPRFVNAAHNRGVRVDVWTIDESEEMRRLLDLGADVIMTNRPEVLEGVLGERC